MRGRLEDQLIVLVNGNGLVMQVRTSYQKEFVNRCKTDHSAKRTTWSPGTWPTIMHGEHHNFIIFSYLQGSNFQGVANLEHRTSKQQVAPGTLRKCMKFQTQQSKLP